jgi:hypothetical protein
MSVSIDKAGGDNMAFGVDHVIGSLVDSTDFRDLTVFDAHIAAIPRAAGTVDNHSVLDNDIVSHVVYSL